ncbi:hypothetical protein LTR47_007449 [Exophiala xenobiotica]|nr:hypothetical protein LTR47_007449 [Exophiala xenobiotica]KAK5247607.1 hypothetical protein LTS06_007302 [Exophiala xenobiotica]KAK5347069.1 hypothetical protein LTR61_009234 [Exophiala xenobiotica]KAK5363215.1 hypothetical protein LTR11_009294 [Exophiala xenobiotica]KAK5364514.1 hypothetical protein LTS03_009291 [Exophiala xenobiotica]
MPRVSSQSGGGRPSRQAVVVNMAREKTKGSPMKLALNDDRGEKAARLQSRQALQEIHMNEIRATASPVRKLNRHRDRERRDTNHSHSRDMDMSESSPRTPRTSDAHLRKKVALHRRQSQQQNQNQRGNNGSPRGGGDNVTTPMKRVPILANFEEWMKMATDNKINAANSWNFALIDYFHDLSLLKEGDGVNFQKASCTLDGCVKIYTSRVDSVATETGRLLSGLADGAQDGKKRSKADGEGEDDDEDGEDGEEGEDGEGKKKSKKKPARSHEATLAPSFASFQGKKLELEFAVDPLFKKASADFDEGGAKGLLLNHLSIDSDGRIVFDSSDDAGDAALTADRGSAQEDVNDDNGDDGADVAVAEATKAATEGGEELLESSTPTEEQDEEIDLGALASKFFPDLGLLDSQDICPSMKAFTLGDPSGDLNIPFLKAPDDWREQKKGAATPARPTIEGNINLSDQTGIFLDGSNAMGFDDDDDDGGLLGGFDVADNVGFGEGGEAWAKDAAIDAQTRVVRADDIDDNLIEGNEGAYAMSLQHKYQEDAEHESIMAYFDKAFNSRAKGKTAFMTLENWRMQKIQKAQLAENAPPTRQRKEKEPFEIDFLGPMSESLKELLEAPAVLNSQISLPKTQWKTKGRNLLDKDDEVVDPRKLMRLWTKPKCRVGRQKGKMAVIDEGFGARNRLATVNGGREGDELDEDEDGRKGDYDADFFADDDQMPFFDGPLPIDDDDDGLGVGDRGDDGQAFMDAREMLSPQPEGQQQMNLLGAVDGEPEADGPQPHQPTDSQAQTQYGLLPGSFGSQLVTQAGRRLRPEYVNYARTAKKVDVRRLKENMWKGMSEKLALINVFERPAAQQADKVQQEQQQPQPVVDEDVDMMDVDEDDASQGQLQGELQQQLVDGLLDGQGKQGLDGGEVLNFTELIQDLRSVYPEQQMKDLSTSYCFICLLHLANEKGLVLEGDLEGERAMQEIRVSRDGTVGEGYEGE